MTLVALAGQVFAVAGTAVELSRGVAEVKSQQLRQLGFDPAVGVTINLAYSGLGFALFCWFAIRWLAARASGVDLPDKHASDETVEPGRGSGRLI